jgi:hypothetical protein
MSVVMLVLGIVVAVAGAAALGFGIRINEYSVGHTLIIAGTTGLAGGLVTIGLSAIIGRLAHIAKALEAHPASHPALVSAGNAEHFQPREAPPAPRIAEPPIVAPVPAPPVDLRPATPVIEPKPAAEVGVDVSASAIERLRSSIARPAKADMVAPPKTDVDPPSKAATAPEADNLSMPPMPVSPSALSSGQNGGGHEPKSDVAARNPTSAAEALKNKRLDFLFRSRATRPTPGDPGEQGEPQWPRRSVRDMQNGGQPGAAAERTVPPMAPDAAAPPPRPEPPRAAAIIKSGVVDGMAYTLYADGSIEAQLPHGTVRFGSITELRSHIEKSS